MPHKGPSHPERLFPRKSGYAPTRQWINQNLCCVRMKHRNKTNHQLLSVRCPARNLPTSWTDHILFPSRAVSSPDSRKLSTPTSLTRLYKKSICGACPGEGRGCASPFVIATYEKIGLIPQASRALHLELFLKAFHLR